MGRVPCTRGWELGVSRSRREFNADVSAAVAAAAAYYNTGTQLIPDVEYDALIDRIAGDVAAHPGWDARGLLSTVAGGVGGGDVPHPSPMLSLAKAVGDDAVVGFITRDVFRGEGFTVEPKMDGLAVRAEYVGGRLVRVVTRGDGVAGEDVTAQALRAPGITGLPVTVPRTTGLDVRGEVYMTDADFDVSNTARVGVGKPAYANPRNATAGALRAGDLEHEVRMSFAAYAVLTDDPVADTHTALMADLAALGFGTAQSLMPGYDASYPDAAVLTTAEHVTGAVAVLQAARASLGFPIDGAVIAVNSITRRITVGADSRTPRWALAWKYPADTATSVLRAIEVSVGRTGRLGLRGVIDPVTVGGVTVTYATLHNPDWVVASGIRVNGPVVVYRAGDVIPRITAPAAGVMPADAVAWTPPLVCPQCEEPLDTSSVLWRCLTPACSTASLIAYAASRDILDLDGLGTEIADALVESGLVTDIADLFTLTADALANVTLGTTPSGAPRRVGATVAGKLAAEIDAARSRPVNRIIAALGIRMTGRTVSRRLAAAFGSIDVLRAATLTDLAAVDGIGPEKAARIHAGLTANASVLDRLTAAGVNMGTPVAPGDAAAGAGARRLSMGVLAGMTVVVTGAMTGPLAALTRNDMNELIEQHGGKASGSVSTKTTLLVCGEPGSSKHAKATSLGVRIVTPDEFADLLGH